MGKDREVIEKQFKKDLLEVINKRYGTDKYTMNMNWKLDVVKEIWADKEGSIGNV